MFLARTAHPSSVVTAFAILSRLTFTRSTCTFRLVRMRPLAPLFSALPFLDEKLNFQIYLAEAKASLKPTNFRSLRENLFEYFSLEDFSSPSRNHLIRVSRFGRSQAT
ncbi:hypothetical protein E2C01_066592 [Portunus trituberculatus]|uniref:Uncharacterized protein n=1 Tax=Portunus trituberculatus TaxID=210409 RepID=A0A5B7HQ74_PORTR|nr:hypothetical protein [Portunus trituberculatus]